MRYFYYVTKDGNSEYSKCGEYKDKGELISDVNKVIIFIEELTEDEFNKIMLKYSE